MGQVPRELRPELSPVHLFGARLRELREAAGLSQARLGQLVAYSGHLIGKVEKGERRPQLDLARRCDDVLRAGGALFDLADRIRAGAHVGRLPAVATTLLAGLGGQAVRRDDVDTGRAESHPVDHVTLPAGRFFDGADIDVRVFPAIHDGRIVAQLPPEHHSESMLPRHRRGLVVGSVQEPEARLYGLDMRYARRRMARQESGSGLVIPPAYLLDEITLGLLWAATNFDVALLADDRILAEYDTRPRRVRGPKHPTTWQPMNLDLSETSAMWLGSELCATHILRNVGRLTDTPAFWTREQRGEEASAWLLFAHKYAYLQHLGERFPEGMTRTFCIPESAVTASATSERILMFLVAGLMESFDIQCQVTSEPEYSTVDGFVLDADRCAIVANWIRVEALWCGDVTDNRPTVREYCDANGYARAHSVVNGPTPLTRLQTMAGYLDLSWPLITRRCAELAENGLDGLAQPRCRLLSLAGAERACRYLGALSIAESQ